MKKPTRAASRLAKNISSRRINLGLTQADLAERANLSPAMISRVESKSRMLRVRNLIKIAKILKCQPKDLTD